LLAGYSGSVITDLKNTIRQNNGNDGINKRRAVVPPLRTNDKINIHDGLFAASTNRPKRGPRKTDCPSIKALTKAIRKALA
jgi:hypothetical protein